MLPNTGNSMAVASVYPASGSASAQEHDLSLQLLQKQQQPCQQAQARLERGQRLTMLETGRSADGELATRSVLCDDSASDEKEYQIIPSLSLPWSDDGTTTGAAEQSPPYSVKFRLLAKLSTLARICGGGSDRERQKRKVRCRSAYCIAQNACDCQGLLFRSARSSRSSRSSSGWSEAGESSGSFSSDAESWSSSGEHSDSTQSHWDDLELSDTALMSLKDVTRFSSSKLREWRDAFHGDCPSGVMRERDLVSLFQYFHPDGTAQQWAKHLFRSFDSEQTGNVDFNRFIYMLSLIRRGTIAQHVCWAFDLYDVHHRGYITHRGMTDVLESIQRVSGYNVGGADASDLAHTFLRVASAYGDEVVNLQQFLSAVLQDDFMVKVALDLV
ncbi:uncharacterized protein LOC135829483 [Sycon ciliatum]|uniref:uncharacterized protein LOC135829483 n=1 Tax=Sycon ciliatum TaxID=27933 RepID=UPI0031F71B16